LPEPFGAFAPAFALAQSDIAEQSSVEIAQLTPRCQTAGPYQKAVRNGAPE
jgi:hypothetical protein